MSRDKTKEIMLVMLVIMTIWQTSKLWLGDMPSFSYFNGQNNVRLQAVEPKSIWMNPGAPATSIYRLGEKNREHQSVKSEIERILYSHTGSADFSEAKELNWEEILSKKGVLFEYPIDITYKEMVGNLKKDPPKQFPITKDIDYVFMQLSEDTRSSANWYVISSKNNNYISLEVMGDFANMNTFNDLLKEEAVSYKVRYQPTFNISGMNKSNIFLPIASKNSPIKNELIEYSNPLEGVEDLSKFNPYINHYFRNHLLKKEEIVNGDTYVFSELMKTVVTYYPSGVFEYSNIAVESNKTKVSRLKAYNIAKNFLITNESLKKETRSKMFLSKIVETDEGYKLYFDIKINGIAVNLSNESKEKLKMDHMARITIKGDEISNFKWNSYEFHPKKMNSEVKTEEFTTKYTDALNTVLEYVASEKDFETLAIDDMQWVYMLEDASETMDVRWVIQHEGEWYSP